MTRGGGRPPIRALVVDDERPARDLIKGLLRSDADITIAGESRTGAEAVSFLDAGGIDLVFLDVQLPDFDGFEVLRRLKLGPLPYVIFVTAHDEHALRAFDVHAVDYLLKPYPRERFYTAVQRARQAIRQQQVEAYAAELAGLLGDRSGTRVPTGSEPGTPYLGEIRVKDGKRLLRIEAARVDRLEADDHYVRLFVGGRLYTVHGTISGFEAQLDPGRFARIHRSTIVNIEQVRELRSDGNGTYSVVLTDGSTHRIGRGYRDRLPDVLPTIRD